MKWLLITTGGNTNPGDQFIRIGVQNLIKDVDPHAEFERLNKEDPEDYNRERPFDRAVLCGMPLFWSNHVSQCREMHWWRPIFRGWITKDPSKFIVLGAGSVVGDNIIDPYEILLALEEVVENSFAITTRDTIIPHPDVISSICPAAFSMTPAFTPRKLALFNAMPDGAHDSHFNPGEAAIWRCRVRLESDAARRNGFHFIAHDETEKEFARELNWDPARVLFFDTPEEYLNAYARASHYYGNRLHGAVAAAVAGANVIPIGYDSRVRMLDRLVPASYAPSDAPDLVSAFYGKAHHRYNIPTTLDVERKRLVNLIHSFAQ